MDRESALRHATEKGRQEERAEIIAKLRAKGLDDSAIEDLIGAIPQ